MSMTYSHKITFSVQDTYKILPNRNLSTA